jgi:hypothetical protein
MHILKLLFPTPPFEIALPYRIYCKNYKEAFKIINQNNGHKRVFYSLYEFDTAHHRHNPQLTKIFFDFDSQNCFDNIVKFAKWCNKNNYRHLIVFSGGGFHAYLFTKNFDKITDAKTALYAIQHDVCKELGFSIGESKLADVDDKIIGDISRIATIPGSFNTKRKKFAIPVNSRDLINDKLTYESIRELAKVQTIGCSITETDCYDIAKYEHVKQTVKYGFKEFKDKQNVEVTDKDLQDFPPCIQNILLDKNKKGDWKGRWICVTWLINANYSAKCIDALAKKYFGAVNRTDNFKNNYNHFKKVKTLELAIKREDIFPSCHKLNELGYCPHLCKWNNIGKISD